MLYAKDYRERAWRSLTGKWGTMAIAALLVSLIEGACGGLAFIGVGTVALILLMGPLAVGQAKMSLLVSRGQNVAVENLFDGFKNFAKSFLLYLINYIFIFLWTLLFIIPGIIKTLSYLMSYYILIDHPEMSANDARKRSMEMMKGNKWRLFCLEFSFIGWILLSFLTFGILLFWILPYMQTAQAEFYLSLLGDEGSNTVITSVDPFDPASDNDSDYTTVNNVVDPFDFTDDAPATGSEPADEENREKSRTEEAAERLFKQD